MVYVPKYLKIGAIVTHWNSVPVDRFVHLNANVFDGGNEAAAVARSVEFLTRRPLRRFAAPFEEWVDLRFDIDGSPHEERFAWQGLDLGAALATPAIGRNVIGFGGDPDLFEIQQAKRVQFAPSSFDPISLPEGPPAESERGVPSIHGSCSNFDYGTVITDHGTYGYVRLWHFIADGVDDIARDFISVLPQLPTAGIVLDIRGNTGGYIAAGERLLQLLTTRWVTPTRFQFKVNEATAPPTCSPQGLSTTGSGRSFALTRTWPPLAETTGSSRFYGCLIRTSNSTARYARTSTLAPSRRPLGRPSTRRVRRSPSERS